MTSMGSAALSNREIVTLCVIGIASAALGFLLQLTAYEQADRDKRGAAGAFGGLLLGSLSAMTQGDDLLLPFVGFGGGGLGALAGWYSALSICRRAISKPQEKAALLFLHEGPVAVRNYLVERDAERRNYSLGEWSAKYGELIRNSKDVVLKAHPSNDVLIESMLCVWIRGLTDMFNYLMVEAGDPQTDRWHLRASFIRFYDRNGARVGEHWISYSGSARPHSPTIFEADSVAFNVVTQEYASPTIRLPNDKDVAQREGEPYWAFAVFRVNHWLALSVDWQQETRQDRNLKLLLTTVGSHLVPAAAALADIHSFRDA